MTLQTNLLSKRSNGILCQILTYVNKIDMESPEIALNTETDPLQIELDWIANNLIRLCLVIKQDGQIHWAMLIEDKRSHGTDISKLQEVMLVYRDVSDRLN